MIKTKQFKLFKNKKAIELSINFIVMLIIAATVFALGMRLMVQFFGGATKIQSQVDQQTKTQIESLLTAGTRVAVPLNKKTILRGKGDLIGIGLLNVMTEEPENTFYLKISCTGICVKAPSITTLPSYKLANNEQKVFSVYFDVAKDTPSGTYIFNVCIRRDEEISGGVCDASVVNELYDKTLHKIYITVP